MTMADNGQRMTHFKSLLLYDDVTFKSFLAHPGLHHTHHDGAVPPSSAMVLIDEHPPPPGASLEGVG